LATVAESRPPYCHLSAIMVDRRLMAVIKRLPESR
jgi:hypothetical protein